MADELPPEVLAVALAAVDDEPDFAEHAAATSSATIHIADHDVNRCLVHLVRSAAALVAGDRDAPMLG